MKKLILLFSLLTLVACPNGSSQPTALDAAVSIAATATTNTAASVVPIGPLAPGRQLRSGFSQAPRITARPDFTHTVNQAVFVLQPSGASGSNFYPDWPTLMASFRQSAGPRWIVADDTFAPCHVTAGSWDVDQTTFVDNFNDTTSVLTFDTGATFTFGHIVLAGGIIFDQPNTATGPVFTHGTGHFSILELKDFAHINSESTHPWALYNDDGGSVLTHDRTGIGNAPGSAGVNVFQVALGKTLFLVSDSISGPQSAGNFWLSPHAIGGAGTAVVDVDDSSPISGTQDVGTLTKLLTADALTETYTPAIVANWNNVAPTSVANALDRIAAKITPIP